PRPPPPGRPAAPPPCAGRWPGWCSTATTAWSSPPATPTRWPGDWPASRRRPRRRAGRWARPAGRWPPSSAPTVGPIWWWPGWQRCGRSWVCRRRRHRLRLCSELALGVLALSALLAQLLAPQVPDAPHHGDRQPEEAVEQR